MTGRDDPLRDLAIDEAYRRDMDAPAVGRERDPVDAPDTLADASLITAALDLGLQAWRTTPSRVRFIEAIAACGRLRTRLEAADRLGARICHHAERLQKLERIEAQARRVEKVYEGLRTDASDGTFALWTEDDLVRELHRLGDVLREPS